MKSVLYVAAALMIGASIYGFVDYSKTKGSKEFDTMYDEKKTSAMVIVEERKPASDVVAVSKKDKPETVKNQTAKTEKVNNEKALKSTKGTFKKKRRLNYKSFSRAALKEEEIVEVPEIREVTVKEQ